MPAPVQERYNAKARGSVAGGSSHKKRKRSRIKPSNDGQEAPAERGELSKILVSEDGMSSKKRKRLDSYIVCATSFS